MDDQSHRNALPVPDRLMMMWQDLRRVWLGETERERESDKILKYTIIESMLMGKPLLTMCWCRINPVVEQNDGRPVSH